MAERDQRATRRAASPPARRRRNRPMKKAPMAIGQLRLRTAGCQPDVPLSTPHWIRLAAPKVRPARTITRPAQIETVGRGCEAARSKVTADMGEISVLRPSLTPTLECKVLRQW